RLCVVRRARRPRTLRRYVLRLAWPLGRLFFRRLLRQLARNRLLERLDRNSATRVADLHRFSSSRSPECRDNRERVTLAAIRQFGRGRVLPLPIRPHPPRLLPQLVLPSFRIVPGHQQRGLNREIDGRKQTHPDDLRVVSLLRLRPGEGEAWQRGRAAVDGHNGVKRQLNIADVTAGQTSPLV